MPSGRTITGLRIPNTAGSNRAEEDTTRMETSTGNSTFAGEARFRVARTRSHDRVQCETDMAKPQSQTHNRTRGIGLTGGAVDGSDCAAEAATNGMLMPATVEIG